MAVTYQRWCSLYNGYEYFTFEESIGGQCTASAYHSPFELIGYNRAYSSVFTEAFKQSKKEDDEIWDWLPLTYRTSIQQGEVQVGNSA
jgi:hypothetical protein